MKFLFTKKAKLLSLAMMLSIVAYTQQQTPLDIALRYTEQEYSRWNLDKADLKDMLVSNQYQTRHNKVTHLYFLQRHAGIPVYNAILSVHVTANGQVGFANSRFIPQLANKINTTTPGITPLQAIVYAARQLELPGKAAPVYLEKTAQNELIFEDKAISSLPIKVRLMYQPMPEGSVQLAWDLAIRQIDSPDYWSVRIDALTGDLLDKTNWTVYCQFDHTETNRQEEDCVHQFPAVNFTGIKQALSQLHSPNVDNAQYNVFPIPIESPLHGQRQIVTGPADPLASPFGWHDTNGFQGAEYRITRGNNVHAFLDLNGRDVSSENEPNGGTSLVFNYSYDITKEPLEIRDASVTQLFYMNNVMHDVAYHYGFDEAAGNFQKNNYGKGGAAEDHVLAHAQDGGGTDNANFSSPPDGSNSTMQMFLWNRESTKQFEVAQPAPIARVYSVGSASFGLQYANTSFTGRIVEAVDNSSNPTLGCQPFINAAAIAGNIALVDRGDCFFIQKVANAQAAGAIGVIVCNYEDVANDMGGANGFPDPTIPAVSLRQSDCRLIRQYLKDSIIATIELPKLERPSQLDGSFDNAIVAHEYAHGISNRLTGGPAAAGCLNNAEQMGEGWSDFFALALTVQPGDVGSKARGMGGFVKNRDARGRGFRRFYYSTDMNINPQTYEDVLGSAIPHGVGEIWASVLWDLYWKMVEVYGWDEDIYNGTGGNNLALQLVMDGMKLQACDPGYIDGRDAILAADILNNEGANQCLIWEVFARRGLGWSADQGSNANRNDGTAAFDIAPECAQQLVLTKKSTPLIKAGDTIAVVLEVTNYKKEMVTEVIVTDELPNGTTYLTGSANAPAQVENSTIRFELEQLQSGESKIFTYKISTSSENFSTRQFLDDFEATENKWRADTLVGKDLWRITFQKAFSGRKSWYIPSTVRRNDQLLQLTEPMLVTGTQPTLRFYHNYDSDPGFDGGIIQISTDNGVTWQYVDSLLFRNGYRGRLVYSTFAENEVKAYWGKNENFVDSYVDLSPFINQEILVRFRFGSLVKENNRNVGTGWWVDDVEFLDLYNYESEACVFTAEGDQVCARSASRGTIVQPQAPLTNTEALQKTPLQVALYPNPARDLLNISISTQATAEATLRIFGADGRLMLQQNTDLLVGNQTVPLRLENLSAGFYLVEVKTANAVITQKLVIK